MRRSGTVRQAARGGRRTEGGLESSDELATEDETEHLDRQKEPVGLGDPARLVWSEASSSGNAVDMRIMLEPLVPGKCLEWSMRKGALWTY
jgi:hypothetical protein